MIIYSRWNCKHFSYQRILDVQKSGMPKTMEQHRMGKYQRSMNRLRFYEVWLRNRIQLFKVFTYPSVMAQTDKDFKWLGLVHRDSPDWFIEELNEFDLMEVCLLDYDIEAGVKGEVSINVDTDDAISRNFIEEAKKVCFEGETIFSHGLKYRIYSDFWMDTHYDDAHFNVVKHPKLTVLDHLHGRFPIPKNIIDTADPRWLQVIHEKNIANKLNPPYSKRKGGPTNMGLKHAKRYFEFDETVLGVELIADYSKRKND